MSVVGGCDSLRGDGVLGGEEFFVSDGFVAAWACAAVADSGHEGAAVFAALGAEEPGFAVRALVDGVGPAGCVGGYGRRCQGWGVAVTVDVLAAGVGAPLAGTACGERCVAGRTFPFRYVSVTRRRHDQRLSGRSRLACRWPC